MSDNIKTIFGMKVQVNNRVPPGEVWLVGPERPALGGGTIRDHIRIVGIEVPPDEHVSIETDAAKDGDNG